eukprot:756543-Hanusia_phi.AAC.1
MGGILSRSGRKTSVDGTHYDAPGRAGHAHPRHHDAAQSPVKRQQGTNHNTQPQQPQPQQPQQQQQQQQQQPHKSQYHHHHHHHQNHSNAANHKEVSPQVSRAPSSESNHGGTDKMRKSKPPALQPEMSLSGLNLTSPTAATPVPRTPESPGVAAFTSNILASAASHEIVFETSEAPEELVENPDVEQEENEMSLADIMKMNNSDTDIRILGDIKRWQRGNLIGSGSFGKVYLGMNLDSGEIFVVKQVMFMQKDKQDAEDVLQLEAEIALLGTLNHPNIVKYLGTERNNITNELSIFLEHMPGGSVAELVSRFGKLDESVIRKYTREVLEGLTYLHDKGIIHRDIKGQNILVDNRGVCKLADFGASRYLQSADSAANLSFKGTPVFMSPEVIMEQRYSKKSDIWSVGCTVLQMATGNPPFSEFSNHIAALFHITASSEPPPIPAELSDSAKDFVSRCFTRDPKERPYARTLRRHPFINRRGVTNNVPPSPAVEPASAK